MKKLQKAKDLNIVDNLLKKYDMDLTQIEIKILYKINEKKEGIQLQELSKNTKIHIGNLSKYVKGLISKGIVEELSKSPKIIKIVKPIYMNKLNLVKCNHCEKITILPKTIGYFTCENCGGKVMVSNNIILGTLKRDTIEKMNGLLYKLQSEDSKIESYDDIIGYLVDRLQS